jgi:hypothetical protein
MGDMIRMLLIQVQKSKVDIELAMVCRLFRIIAHS